MTDTRIAYGTRCTWWDSIYKVGKRGSLPACPHCGCVLFEMPDEATFLSGIPAYEAAGHPGYGEIVMWARGKCFPGPAQMEAAFASKEANPHG